MSEVENNGIPYSEYSESEMTTTRRGQTENKMKAGMSEIQFPSFSEKISAEKNLKKLKNERKRDTKNAYIPLHMNELWGKRRKLY